MSNDRSEIDEVLSCEDARIRSLVDKDYASLQSLLDESLVHVHTTGNLETYTSYLDGVRTKLEFLAIDRGALAVRIFGHTAVMTGPLDQHIRIRGSGNEMILAAIATQVWVRSGDSWKLASFHACRRE